MPDICVIYLLKLDDMFYFTCSLTIYDGPFIIVQKKIDSDLLNNLPMVTMRMN